MGKKLTIIVFLIATGIAVTLFLRQKTFKPAGDRSSEHEPRLTLDEFAIYRYLGSDLEASFSGKIGHYVEPSQIEVYDEIRGMRQRSDGSIESLRCEAAAATLDTEGIGAFASNNTAQVIHGEVADDVQIGLGQDLLTTEFAEYFFDSDIIVSREPVSIIGESRRFDGSQGFRYSLSKEILLMEGPVSGVVEPQDLSKK